MPYEIMETLHLNEWSWLVHVAFWLLIILSAAALVVVIKRLLFSRSKNV